MSIKFEVLAGERRGETIEWQEGLLRIGRSDDNEMCIPDWHISGRHAEMALAGDRWFLRDTLSTNGTRVRRESETIDLATLPGRELELQMGDRIELGDPEHPVLLSLSLEENEDEAEIVSLRRVEELGRVEASLQNDAAVLKSLYEAQKVLSANIEVDPLIDQVSAKIFEFLPRATHVTVALREEDEEARHPRYVPVGTRVRGQNAHTDAIPITRSVFRKVVAERAAVLAADARRDVGETASIMGAHIQSTLGVPLWQGQEIIGVIQVDNRDQPGMFREHDLDILALLSQTASQAFAHAQLYGRLRVAEEKLRKENVYLKRREEKRTHKEIIGDSPIMQKLFDQLKRVVNTRVTVLIEGETGAGKELIASAVHYWSDRRDKLFIAQNCAALPENLLESELFGHKRGSFTGATDDKKGLFEIASGGTLFLDELGEMPLSLQAKLLRALQENEIRPVGASKTIKVDCRIVAATNRDLEREVSEGRFREDLYYRLKVFPVQVPSLRERREDIPLLAAFFLSKFSEDFGKVVGGFSQQAMELLQGYAWPGNVRELSNEVQRLVIQVDDNEFVQPDHLSPKIRQVENIAARIHPEKGTLKEMMDQVERWILLEALKEHNNNKSQTAKTLGITREGLHKKLRSLGL